VVHVRLVGDEGADRVTCLGERVEDVRVAIVVGVEAADDRSCVGAGDPRSVAAAAVEEDGALAQARL